MLGSNSVRHIAKMAERYLVVAYFEADRARVNDNESWVRPYIGKDSAGVQAPIMQWVGFICHQGQLSVTAYDMINGEPLTTKKNDKRPIGLPGLINDNGSLKPGYSRREIHTPTPLISYTDTQSANWRSTSFASSLPKNFWIASSVPCLLS